MAYQPFLASNSFEGDGTTLVWEFSFEGLTTDAPLTAVPYIHPDDVHAEFITGEGESQVAVEQSFTFETGNSIRLATAPPVGTLLRIYRQTENRFPLVNYQDLQSVGSSDLDLANRQAVYIVQEAFDAARGAGNVSAETLAAMAGLVVEAANNAADAEAQATAAAASAALAASYLAGSMVTVDSIDDLRLLSPAAPDVAVLLRGYYSTHPNIGGGMFIWRAGSTAADNDGSIIKVTALTTGRWLRVGGPAFSIEDFGAAEHRTTAENTASINAAITAAAGAPVRIPARRYKYSGSLDLDAICIVGERMPGQGASNGSLVNGSILEGVTAWKCDYGIFSNFGVDHGADAFPAIPANAISITSRSYNSGRQVVMTNCVGLGSGPDDAFHAILIQGFSKVFMTRCVGVRTFYGFAVKAGRCVIDGFLAEDTGLYGGIIKSDLAQGTTNDILVSNMVVEGNVGATNIGLQIESADAQLVRYQVHGLTTRNCTAALRVAGDVIATDGVISGVIAAGCTTDALRLTGTVYNLAISDVALTGCSARALEVEDVRHLKVSNFTASSVADGGANFGTDFIRIGAKSTRTMMTGVALTDNYSGTAGAQGMIQYNNARGQNVITDGYYKLSGTGAPVTQLITVTTEPTGAVFLQTYKVAKLRAGWTGTATRDWRLQTDNVPDGHIVVVENATGQSLQVRNGSDSVVITTLATARSAEFICVNGYYNLLRNEAL